MMPDDHEMIDNWEPGFKTKNQQWKDEGLKAYWQYQRMDDPKKNDVYITQTVCGFALFMADSRTDRTLRTANIPGHIMGREQLQALQAWLLTQQSKDATAPKFVACAAMVLPRHVGLPPTLSAASGCLSEDAWDGYPNSLAALLGFIAEKEISGVVFLSRDAHLGNVTEVTVGTVKLVSIHAPALYAPFPFANAKPSDFANDETFTFPYKNQSYACTVSTQFPPAEDGFVTVRPFQKDAVWRLDIQMHGVKTPPWSQQINL